MGALHMFVILDVNVKLLIISCPLNSEIYTTPLPSDPVLCSVESYHSIKNLSQSVTMDMFCQSVT